MITMPIFWCKEGNILAWTQIYAYRAKSKSATFLGQSLQEEHVLSQVVFSVTLFPSDRVGQVDEL
jgi:hypothetical protein